MSEIKDADGTIVTKKPFQDVPSFRPNPPKSTDYPTTSPIAGSGGPMVPPFSPNPVDPKFPDSSKTPPFVRQPDGQRSANQDGHGRYTDGYGRYGFGNREGRTNDRDGRTYDRDGNAYVHEAPSFDKKKLNKGEQYPPKRKTSSDGA